MTDEPTAEAAAKSTAEKPGKAKRAEEVKKKSRVAAKESGKKWKDLSGDERKAVRQTVRADIKSDTAERRAKRAAKKEKKESSAA